jgi:hypothetical protein
LSRFRIRFGGAKESELSLVRGALRLWRVIVDNVGVPGSFGCVFLGSTALLCPLWLFFLGD